MGSRGGLGFEEDAEELVRGAGFEYDGLKPVAGVEAVAHLDADDGVGWDDVDGVGDVDHGCW